jgi:hypothetical protein
MRIVQGLLAKAQSTDFPDEAEALMSKAQTLMTEHAIDEAMVAAADGGQRAEVERITIVCEAPYATAKVFLLHRIAMTNHCQTVRVGKGANQTIEVFGYGVDLAHVEALYTHLSFQATRAVLAEEFTARRFRHAFLLAFAGRVYQRLEEARRVAQAAYEEQHASEGGSVALVLADRSGEVEHAFKAAYPRTRRARTSTSSRYGQMAGDAAGRRADLGGDRLDSPTRGALPS